MLIQWKEKGYILKDENLTSGCIEEDELVIFKCFSVSSSDGL
jgi:hypothetical protein